MEPTLDIFMMQSLLAKNIDVKDTLDYVLFGVQEPKIWEQFLLLGPIFSGFRTHHFFVGVTTSGILFVEVNSRFEEKKHRFYKYYELNSISQEDVLKGKEITLELRNEEKLKVVLPRVVLGLNSQEENTVAALRVVKEKIRASKEYFRNNPKNPKKRRNDRRRNNFSGNNRNTNPHSNTQNNAESNARSSTGQDKNDKYDRNTNTNTKTDKGKQQRNNSGSNRNNLQRNRKNY